MEISDALIEHRQAAASMELDQVETAPTSNDASFGVGGLILTLDTNILITHLILLRQVIGTLRALTSPPIRFLVPHLVIRELDGLKSSNKLVTPPPQEGTSQSKHSLTKRANVELASLARRATSFILETTAALPHLIKTQRRMETFYPKLWASNASADDKIMDAALFWNSQLPGQVGIVTNDRNLCVKAVAEGIPAVTVQDDTTLPSFLAMIHPTLPGVLLPPPKPPSSTPPLAQTSKDPDMQLDTETHLFDADALLSDISINFASLVRLPLYTHLVGLLGLDSATHLLRSQPNYAAWTAGHCVQLIQQFWASLEEVCLAPTPKTNNTSRWAKPPPGPSAAQRRSTYKAALDTLRTAFDRRRPASAEGYGLPPDQWTKRQWTSFIKDTETVLMSGQLLQANKQGIGSQMPVDQTAWPSADAAKAAVESWREAVQWCNHG